MAYLYYSTTNERQPIKRSLRIKIMIRASRLAVGTDSATSRGALLQPSLGPSHDGTRFRRNSKRTLNVSVSWSRPSRIPQVDTEDVSFLPRCELPVGVSIRRVILACYSPSEGNCLLWHYRLAQSDTRRGGADLSNDSLSTGVTGHSEGSEATYVTESRTIICEYTLRIVEDVYTIGITSH